MPLARGFDSTFGYLHAFNGYLHSWAGAGCPAYPGVVSYPNGTREFGMCTEASVKARHLQHVTDLWEDGGPATGMHFGGDCAVPVARRCLRPGSTDVGAFAV